MAKPQNVELEVAGQNFNFIVRDDEYRKLIDGSASGKVTQTAFNFCSKAVKKDQQTDLLDKFEQYPGLDLILADQLSELYSPVDLARMVKPVKKPQKES